MAGVHRCPASVRIYKRNNTRIFHVTSKIARPHRIRFQHLFDACLSRCSFITSCRDSSVAVVMTPPVHSCSFVHLLNRADERRLVESHSSSSSSNARLLTASSLASAALNVTAASREKNVCTFSPVLALTAHSSAPMASARSSARDSTRSYDSSLCDC